MSQRNSATKGFFAVALVLLAIGLDCCAHYQPQPISPKKAQEDFLHRSFSDPGLKAFLEANLPQPLNAGVRASWDLDSLTLAAFYFHPGLDVARAQWAEAKGGMITAGQRPNPSFNITPGYDTTTSVPSPWLPFGSLDIPIETAGKRHHRMVQAAQLAIAARLNLASVAWQVRSGVRRALLGLYAAQQAQALLQDQQALQIENLKVLEGQYKAGAVSAFELTQARISANAARLALHDAEQQRSEASVQVAEAIGVPSDALKAITLSFDSFKQLPGEAPLKEARRKALLNRSDILGALASYAASEAALRLEIANQYPDLDIGPGYQYDQGENKWSIGLTIRLPVFNQNQGPIAEAKAKRAEAQAQFQTLQAHVLAALDTAVATYRLARQKAKDAQAMLADLKNQEHLAKGMFHVGEISKSELIARRMELSASALASLDALIKAQQALGALEDAVQVPMGLPNTVWEAAPNSQG